jgi:hypothetical protein
VDDFDDLRHAVTSMKAHPTKNFIVMGKMWGKGSCYMEDE